jgi:cell fate regulator YaaT (PSP1 superfamily)
MSLAHLVRIGVMGHVGRFTAVDATHYPRAARVVVRTARGLELGEVLAREKDQDPPASVDGPILRGMTVEDQLLETRLNARKQEALDACIAQLAERKIGATLIDVEHLFDGRTLWFHFLGEVTPQIEQLTAELAELYEAKVKFRQFTDAVTIGCGPNCGTEAAEGGCSACTTCAVAGACGSRS